MSACLDMSEMVAKMMSQAAQKSAEKKAAQVAAPNADKARAFMLALRNAGKREIKGRQVYDAALVRGDEQFAITTLCGYKLKEPHGSQLDAARRLATSLLSPVEPGAEYHRAHAAPTVAGFVAGMPSASERSNGQLEAAMRELIAQAAEAEHDGNSAKAEALAKQIANLRDRIR